MTIEVEAGRGMEMYNVALDGRLGPGQWERLYLEEGFRRPDGTEIPPAAIRRIAVRPGETQAVNDNLLWLTSQVDEICALAA